MRTALSVDERRASGRASQEATWAGASSPVSRLLNPVSTSRKQEAQPPTADISDSLYDATRPLRTSVPLSGAAQCRLALHNFVKQKTHFTRLESIHSHPQNR